ncbi:MAG TPA: baseplate J/gp47 family protein [Crinalium sp.]|jgi:hypothetical protein
MSFRRRTFPEVLDNLLTDVTQGVAAESHPFPPVNATAPPYQHDLQQPPIAEIISVYGSRDGEPHLFRKDVDYQLVSQKTLVWKDGAELPDPGTLVNINYYPTSAKPVLTDIQTGSVVRTLAESVALEMARLYAQLEVIYDSGFIDTATGRALDNVVALLGVERIRGGRATGDVEFTRSPASTGTIDIPAGTRIITADGSIEYETTASVTMGLNQNTIRVVARDLEANPILSADSLTVLPIPIAGIASVTNPAPTAIATQDETDTELRARAKNFLHGSERATLGAIKQAIALQGIKADVVEVAPGYIDVTPQVAALTPEQKQRLEKAIYDARPAGIVVTVKSPQPPKTINLELRLTTANGLLEQDIRAVQRELRDQLTDYFARLPVTENGSINRIVGLALSNPKIQDIRLISATLEGTDSVLDLDSGELTLKGIPTVLGDLHMANPALPTQLSVVVTYPSGQPIPNQATLQAAIGETVNYLNTLNASELPATPSTVEQAKRVLSYGKLVIPLPLPNQVVVSLADYDEAIASGTAPTLPTETTIQPYQVKFVLTLDSGLSHILSTAADTYSLTPFERLSLTTVTVQEASNG